MSDPSETEIDVRYLANLSRLALTDEEVKKFQKQLQQIVRQVGKIAELDLSGIEPTAHAHPVHNIFREDEVRPCLEREAVLANAPSTRQGHFKVPQIIE
ncbi:MAG: Asp-tRNA(Asn)/Glu-tRNA(Gln) amidotransferase subunit GatC [Verrucomicrobia bacterium]|nr:Asp-tRNA(Asn)/Glu-tRNA(Gln) amidotransferase subunit GatC [Verrucomicrobiota bacterium]